MNTDATPCTHRRIKQVSFGFNDPPRWICDECGEHFSESVHADNAIMQVLFLTGELQTAKDRADKAEAANKDVMLHYETARADLANTKKENDELRAELDAASEHILWCQAFKAQHESLARDAGLYHALRFWLKTVRLLHYERLCTRPDGTHGPAWIVRKPHSIDGDSCVGWHANNIDDAIKNATDA